MRRVMSAKKKRRLMITGAVLLMLFAAGLTAWKLQVNAERDRVILAYHLAQLGDEAIKEQNLVKAREYYERSYEHTGHIVLWAQKNELRKALEKILNNPAMKKTAEGYVLHKGKWVPQEQYIDEKSGHARIFRETKEQLAQAIALFKSHNYREAAQAYFTVLRRLMAKQWLRERFDDTDSIARMAAAFPFGVTSTLHLAAAQDDAPVALLLIEHGASLDNQDEKGRTPLMLAVLDENDEMAALLLEHGANPDIKSAEGATPLLVAVPDTLLVKTLIEHGADPNIAGRDGNTPLHLAVKSGNIDIAGMLLGAGARPDARNRWGMTPLHEAVRSPDLVKLLLEAGAKPSIRDVNGRTALHLAARQGSAKTVRLLLAHGAKVNVRDRAGRTPLHMAIRYPGIARILLKHGASTRIMSARGETPFTLAVKRCNSRLIKTMLDFGANPDSRDRSGTPAPVLAYRCSNRDSIIGLLLKKGGNDRGLRTLLKRDLASRARGRANQELDRISAQVQAILDREYSNLLTGTSLSTRQQLNALAMKAASWFEPLRADGSNLGKVLQSGITAFNNLCRHYGSFTLDRTLGELYQSVKNLVQRYGNQYTLKVFYGRKSIALKARSRLTGRSIETNRVTDGTPFIYGGRNYLVMQQFADLPGVEDVMAKRMLNRLVEEEIRRFRGLGGKI